ncbi:MAG: tol-pal system protein YbgF [Azoarcus sp.]|jgi:tol-pal system protein YbgF|nr:tol-pal system protein YbgF [Azoarcus sp.]
MFSFSIKELKPGGKLAAKCLLPVAIFAACSMAGPAWAGLFDDTGARQQIDELKRELQGRMETVSNGQLDLASQNEELRAEVARLRGQVEMLLNEIESLKTRQHDFYVDLNNRLGKFETNAPGTAASAGGAAPGSYESALNFLKEGRSAEALAEFNTFIGSHPESDNLPDAYFWAGTAALQTKDVAAASKHFNVVLSRWPKSAVAPDAMLGLANGQIAIGDQRNARRTLNSLVERYPSSDAAKTAKQHLSAR